MTRLVLVFVLGWSAPAFADQFDTSTGAGPAIFAVGDSDGVGVSALARVDYVPRSWFRIGLHGQVVAGRNRAGYMKSQGVLAVLPQLPIGERFTLGAGVGATQAWHDMDARARVGRVFLITARVTLHQAGSSRFGLELDVFGGPGTDPTFPDERMGIALESLVTW